MPSEAPEHLSTTSRIKGGGYLLSTISVFLLAIPGWKSAMEHPPMMLALLGGMALSIGGMALRWLSHRREMRAKGRE
jgi:hypothetical protein